MSGPATEPEDIGSLYLRAFKDYGSRALWNMRLSRTLPPPTHWRSRRHCESTAAWTGGVWRNTSKDCAVPLTKPQSHVLRVLAVGRSLDSYSGRRCTIRDRSSGLATGAP